MLMEPGEEREIYDDVPDHESVAAKISKQPNTDTAGESQLTEEKTAQ